MACPDCLAISNLTLTLSLSRWAHHQVKADASKVISGSADKTIKVRPLLFALNCLPSTNMARPLIN